MTWRSDIGLKFYVNGKEVAADDMGKDVSAQTNSKKPNLCFGRDILGTSLNYAKFRIGSFSSFNTFLTSSMMRYVYTFYSRSGKNKLVN